MRPTHPFVVQDRQSKQVLIPLSLYSEAEAVNSTHPEIEGCGGGEISIGITSKFSTGRPMLIANALPQSGSFIRKRWREALKHLKQDYNSYYVSKSQPWVNQ